MHASQGSPLWRFVAKRDQSILPLNEGGGSCPLYFIHSISGELTSLLDLVRLLGTDRQIYGVQVPRGRLDGDFSQTIETMAAHYVELVNSFQPEGPLMLGGWSAGAVIALEMARMLRAHGRDIRLLVAFDGLLYNTPADLTWRRPAFYAAFVVNLMRRIALTLKARWDVRAIGARVVRECRRIMVPLRRLRPQGGSGHGLDVYLDTSGWPVDQAAFARGLYDAAMRYKPLPYTGRVLLYAARIRPIFTLSPVIAAWREVARDIAVIEVDGTHTNILHLPRVITLAGDLRQRLSHDDLEDR